MVIVAVAVCAGATTEDIDNGVCEDQRVLPEKLMIV